MKTHKNLAGTISLAMIIILFAQCGGGKTENGKPQLDQNPPFKILDAYYQDWVAGIPEGGSGTNIYISLGDISEDVVIDKIYFRKMISDAKLSPQTKNQYIGYFRKDQRQDIIMDIDPVKEAQNIPREPFPFELKDDEAVIAYRHENEMKYTRVSDLRMEELLAYPSTKPKDDN
ncbi:MAG: hypothetical protein KJO05_08300 [Bacteroidia bacterium]|nr:hypothetical protein [Bacteroidia bacterium]NNF31542.1 hypothetical protein [Flavobacteriaceae bacterium]MBT8275617.1 hypothetical protein [Bacteroidia bacterium]NNJ82372.1 hypothetical protein [Flavobacteriaceae bacterium]NNK54121.1 hypothetical protein [Flavobacteriaceae bacterium]